MHAHGRRKHPVDEEGRRLSAEAAGQARAASSSAPPSAEAVRALQRSIGNAATARLVAARSESEEPEAPEAPVQRSAVPGVLRSSGRPLDEATRTDMESRLGAEFSDVRLHTDTAARESAAEIGARAYTSGNHVVLGEGGGDPHTLAHELAHVVQQRSGPVAGTDNGSGLRVSDPADRFERAAEETATRAMSRPVAAPDRVTAGGPAGETAVQRAPAGVSAAQQSLHDLAGRWKTQTFFALTTGRSNELQRVDAALAAWRQALDANPADAHQDHLRAISDAIARWQATKGTGSRSGRAVHIKSLARRVARAMNDGGAAAAGAALVSQVAELDEDEDIQPGTPAAGGRAQASEGSEDEFFDETKSSWNPHSSASESEGESESGAEPWRFSTNKRMALGRRSEGQDFFATAEVLTAANAALAGRGSPLQLRSSGTGVPQQLADLGLQKVEPVMVVHGAERRGADLLDVNECIEVARKVTGDQVDTAMFAPEQAGGQRVSHKQNPNDAKGFTAYPRTVTRPGMTPEGLTRNLTKDDGYVSFSWRNATIDADLDDRYDGELSEAIPDIQRDLVAAGMDAAVARTLLKAMESTQLEYYPGLQQILVDRLETAGLLEGEHADEIRAMAQRVSTLDKSRYRPYEGAPNPGRDRRLGINDAAAPEVGESYGIYSTRDVTKEEQQAGKSAGKQPPWTYHFAGVVAKDGDDTVTLENYNRRGKPDGNARWYFGLYGPGRTFHGKHKETVTGAVTLAMG